VEPFALRPLRAPTGLGPKPSAPSSASPEGKANRMRALASFRKTTRYQEFIKFGPAGRPPMESGQRSSGRRLAEAAVEAYIAGGAAHALAVLDEGAPAPTNVKEFVYEVLMKLVEAGFDKNLVEAEVNETSGDVWVYFDDRVESQMDGLKSLLGPFGGAKVESTPEQDVKTGTYVVRLNFKKAESRLEKLRKRVNEEGDEDDKDVKKDATKPQTDYQDDENEAKNEGDDEDDKKKPKKDKDDDSGDDGEKKPAKAKSSDGGGGEKKSAPKSGGGGGDGGSNAAPKDGRETSAPKADAGPDPSDDEDGTPISARSGSGSGSPSVSTNLDAEKGGGIVEPMGSPRHDVLGEEMKGKTWKTKDGTVGKVVKVEGNAVYIACKDGLVREYLQNELLGEADDHFMSAKKKPKKDAGDDEEDDEEGGDEDDDFGGSDDGDEEGDDPFDFGDEDDGDDEEGGVGGGDQSQQDVDPDTGQAKLVPDDGTGGQNPSPDGAGAGAGHPPHTPSTAMATGAGGGMSPEQQMVMGMVQGLIDLLKSAQGGAQKEPDGDETPADEKEFGKEMENQLPTPGSWTKLRLVEGAGVPAVKFILAEGKVASKTRVVLGENRCLVLGADKAKGVVTVASERKHGGVVYNVSAKDFVKHAESEKPAAAPAKNESEDKKNDEKKDDCSCGESVKPKERRRPLLAHESLGHGAQVYLGPNRYGWSEGVYEVVDGKPVMGMIRCRPTGMTEIEQAMRMVPRGGIPFATSDLQLIEMEIEQAPPATPVDKSADGTDTPGKDGPQAKAGDTSGVIEDKRCGNCQRKAESVDENGFGACCSACAKKREADEAVTFESFVGENSANWGDKKAPHFGSEERDGDSGEDEKKESEQSGPVSEQYRKLQESLTQAAASGDLSSIGGGQVSATASGPTFAAPALDEAKRAAAAAIAARGGRREEISEGPIPLAEFEKAAQADPQARALAELGASERKPVKREADEVTNKTNTAGDVATRKESKPSLAAANSALAAIGEKPIQQEELDDIWEYATQGFDAKKISELVGRAPTAITAILGGERQASS
jgi:hypothetical protein